METKPRTEFGSHITESYTEQTGGGVMVDYLRLTDDNVIAITDEVVSLLYYRYPDMTDWGDEIDHVSIYGYGNDEDIDYKGGSLTFVDEITVSSDDGIMQYDIVILKNGIIVIIDDAQITVFEDWIDAWSRDNDRNKYGRSNKRYIGIINRP